MRATVGISVEKAVVRGVVVPVPDPDGPPTGRRVHRIAVAPSAVTTSAVPEVLDEIEAAVGPHVRIEDVAVVHRCAAERRAVVSALSGGRWGSASLVSVRAALTEAVRDLPEVAGRGDALVIETVDHHTRCLLVGPDRPPVPESWHPGIVDAASARAALTRLRRHLDSAAVTAVTVVLCGAQADHAAIAAALGDGLGVAVLRAPEAATIAAEGAALLVARRVEHAEPVSVPAPSTRAPKVAATAAAAVLLGATGYAIGQVETGASDPVAIGYGSRSPQTPPAAVPGRIPVTTGKARPGPPPIVAVDPAEIARATVRAEPPASPTGSTPPPRISPPDAASTEPPSTEPEVPVVVRPPAPHPRHRPFPVVPAPAVLAALPTADPPGDAASQGEVGRSAGTSSEVADAEPAAEEPATHAGAPE